MYSFSDVIKGINKLSLKSDYSDNDSAEEEISINPVTIKTMDNSNRPEIMENLIGAINKIQDVMNTLKVSNSIELPQIVMLGSQSTGKSSVLESIVHRPFLPRGSGIVTRCPLVLQLVECKMNNTKHRKQANGTTEIEEWGEFLHLKDQIFSDFDLIRKEIEDQTDRLAGSNKGICHEPINLKIYSPHVVTLTLVDLPGITKVAVGDQPEDIEDQIKKLVMQYIENPLSIILSVSTANTDIANSESLKYAKRVDPDGDRTLAILTKIDLMDKGTDAMEMLSGQVIPVKLGIIGIINRSQQDINENKTIDEQLIDEKAFFEKNYKEIAHRNGIPFLSKRLSEMLMNHINDSLPNLKLEISNKLIEYQKVHEACGEEVKDRDKIIVGIVTKITKFFTEIIDGKSAKKITDIKALCGGPKFRRIFDESFTAALVRIEPELNKHDIIQYISNNGGPRPAVFAPENLFEKLVHEQIEHLREPSVKCVENSYDEMGRVILKLVKEQHVLARFHVLEKKIYSVLKNFLNDRLPLTKDAINKLIDTELSSINTNHPDFSIESALKEDTNRSAKIDKDAEIIEHLVKHYFPIVKKTIQDQIPKIIIHEMIKYMKDNIESELLGKLYKENQLEMLQESETNTYRRENAKSMIQALKVAKETIEEIEMGY